MLLAIILVSQQQELLVLQLMLQIVSNLKIKVYWLILDYFQLQLWFVPYAIVVIFHHKMVQFVLQLVLIQIVHHSLLQINADLVIWITVYLMVHVLLIIFQIVYFLKLIKIYYNVHLVILDFHYQVIIWHALKVQLVIALFMFKVHLLLVQLVLIITFFTVQLLMEPTVFAFKFQVHIIVFKLHQIQLEFLKDITNV